MIPFLLAAVGGYLLGDSMKENQTFAKGGKTGIKSFMYRVRFKNRGEESFSAYNLKDLKEQVIAKFGSTDDVTLVERWDLKNRGYNVVESTRSKKFADGGPVQEIEQGDKVIFRGNEYIVTKITNENVAGFIDTKWYLDSTKKGVKPLVLDTPKEIIKMANGGETEDDDMGVQFIDYKDKEIMFEPHFKKYYSNDIEFDSLEEAKKYIDSGSKSPAWERAAYRSGIMADGGETEGTFRNGIFEDRTPPKFPDYLTEVKYAAKEISKQRKNKTYVFQDIWNKGVSENYSWGQDKDLEYMKEKGMDFKVIATYENGEEKK
jgi:hypothetical protein